jgi:hypothetical protein
MVSMPSLTEGVIVPVGRCTITTPSMIAPTLSVLPKNGLGKMATLMKRPVENSTIFDTVKNITTTREDVDKHD